MELVNWLLRKYADEQSLSDQDALFHGASQEDGETENDFYVRLKGRRRGQGRGRAIARRNRVGKLAVQSAETQVGEDVPPVRKARTPKSLREGEKLLVVHSLGATEDPSGAPFLLHSSGVSLLPHTMEQQEPSLQERLDGRVRRA